MAVIDAMVAELDRVWQIQPYDEEAFKRLIASVPTQGPEREPALVELCAVDLEWRWRLSLQKPLADSTNETIPRRPSARDYEGLLGSVWTNVNWRRELVLAEWRARSALGDQPLVEDFLDRNTQDVCNEDVLQEVLEEIAPCRGKVYVNTEQITTFRLPPHFVLGRQHLNEPVPPVWLPESQKLVVAPANELRISRLQIELHRTQVEHFTLLNVSSKVAIEFEGRQLAPLESKRLIAPFSVGILDVTLQVDVQRT